MRGIDRLTFIGYAGESGREALDELPTVRLEAQTIEHVLPKLGIERAGERVAGEVFAERIRQPGAWVHVATHGATIRGLPGYSGIWLAGAQPGATPQFMSWLSIGEHVARAEVVVLNACALADEGTASTDGGASFARALGVSGVRNVVAALWPISDTSSRVWIPSFYAAFEHDTDIAAALRHAQLALRNSVHYRHPFYWASLMHLTN